VGAICGVCEATHQAHRDELGGLAKVVMLKSELRRDVRGAATPETGLIPGGTVVV
jgi:hypothetical protein